MCKWSKDCDKTKTMEPNAKKPKPNEPTPPADFQFLDLIDDCIRHILWELPPADLCSISFTCRRMQLLAFDHFPRQYPDEQLIVKMDRNNRNKAPFFRHNNKAEMHLKYFAKCIRNVRIESAGTHARLQVLFAFVDAECCADLRTLQLDVEGNLKSESVQVIENRLENLLSLSIHHPNHRMDIHDVLLKRCKKIEKFEIRSHGKFDDFWMMHAYPTIKSLHVDVRRQITYDHVFETFFQLNPQITNFQCWGVDVTNFIFQHVNCIERMTLCLYNWRGLTSLMHRFRDYSKDRRFVWLELKMQSFNSTADDFQNLEKINALQPIHSLQLNRLFCPLDSTNESTLISKLKSIVKLEVYITFSEGIHKFLAALSKQLPNLQQLTFSSSTARELIFKDVVMHLVQYSTKMKNLQFKHCTENTFVFHPNDLVELNELRWSICSATPMTIRLGYRETTYARPQFNYTAISAVNIKFT